MVLRLWRVHHVWPIAGVFFAVVVNVIWMAVLGYAFLRLVPVEPAPPITADPMSSIERLLVPGSTELPGCHCGDEMRIASLDPVAETTDAHIRIYKCPSCAREMRLTVWASEPGS